MTTLTPAHRDRLEEVRERKAKARQRMAAARQAIRIAGEHNDPGAASHAEVALEEARGQEGLAIELESVLLHQVAGLDGGAFASESFLDDPTTVRTLEQLANSTLPIGNMMLGPAHSRDQLVAMIESGSWGAHKMAASGPPDLPDNARVGSYYGVLPQLRRPLRLLDLIPASPMEGNSFKYTPEGGDLDDAAETAEGSIKPEGEMTLGDAEVVAKTIATWLPFKRQQLADAPSLGTAAQQRLVYKVLRRVERQIVAGDGVGEHLLGIVNTSGIADIPYTAGEPLSDLVLDAKSTVILSDAEPNAVVLNPLDEAAMLKAKTSGSGQRLDSAGGFATDDGTLWGLQRISSRVMPQGQALVGDWTLGCRLYVREAVNVRISDSDQDDFVRNQLKMLGEGRYGLQVGQPTAFALVHLA